MNAIGTLEQNSVDRSAEQWAAGIVGDLNVINTMTIGLTSGSRYASDQRAVDGLAQAIHSALSKRRDAMCTTLVLRLKNAVSSEQRLGVNEKQIGPSIIDSKRGGWSEVTVPVPISNGAYGSNNSVDYLSHWMTTWKQEFRVILVDLGPICTAPSRMIGRLCDGCYILLGPETCGSREWILRHVAWHQQSGSTICGTLVVRSAG